MDFKEKKVFITGAGGFIASHLLEKLAKQEAKITAFVRYNSRNDFGLIEYLPKRVKERIDIIPGDIRDYNAVYGAMKGADIIFHLAALIAIPYSYIHPREVIETNIMGTFNVLEAAKNLKVKKIVHTSSSEVYGSAITVPIAENHPLQGQSPYSASKIGADKIAESFFSSYNLPVAVIRPFNTYGPRQSARAVIPTIISQALAGACVRLGSLYPKRDFTYVSDTVDGFIKVAESQKAIGEVVNVGSGTEISIEELVSKVAKIIGKRIKIIAEENRTRPKNSEVKRLLADNRSAKILAGWEPEVYLEEGLRLTIDWIKNNKAFYKQNIYNI